MNATALILVSAALEAGLLAASLFKILPALGVEVPPWLSVGLVGGWLSYEVVTFGPKRRALQGPRRFGPDRVVGRAGVALTPVGQEGRVQVDREIWRAVSAGEEIPSGAEVEVVARRGILLTVRPLERRGSGIPSDQQPAH